MDPLVAFLNGPRAEASFVLKGVFRPPWSMRIEDEAALAVIAITAGQCWIVPHPHATPATPIKLTAGDVALIRGGLPYVMADRVDREPNIVIDEDGNCVTREGEQLIDTMGLGVRTWGNDLHGSDVMLIGTYRSAGELGQFVLDSLPDLVVVPRPAADDVLVDVLGAEIARDAVGQQVVLDRLLDLVLIATLRSALAAGIIAPPPWLRAHDDPIVSAAVRLMQERPDEPWTVATLASTVGVSRAWLSRRFHEVVGEPPMSFLTSWRMALAADLITAPSATVAAVSQQVGYSSPFTFSTAFKRHHGLSPRHYRDRAVAASA